MALFALEIPLGKRKPARIRLEIKESTRVATLRSIRKRLLAYLFGRSALHGGHKMALYALEIP